MLSCYPARAAGRNASEGKLLEVCECVILRNRPVKRDGHHSMLMQSRNAGALVLLRGNDAQGLGDCTGMCVAKQEGGSK